MSARQTTAALGAILALYLLLGAVYGAVTPVFEAPDESYHFFVIKHILDRGALPIQGSDQRGLWEQEGSQPPLYYLLGALLISGIDVSDAEDMLWRNPQANIGDPTNPGNKNVYIHHPEQAFPWVGTARAVHVMRFVSLAMGAGTVYLVWRITSVMFPEQQVLPLAVAGGVAFIPQFLFVSSSVNNDNAMVLLATAVLYQMLVLVERSAGEDVPGAHLLWARWALLGLLLGLAMLAKLSALALLPLVMVAVALAGWHRRSWRTSIALGAATLVPAILVSGWWYARNVVLYGDPTGLSAMWETVGLRQDFGENLWGEFRALRYSFWGLFGWFSIAMPNWTYLVLDVLSGLAGCGLCACAGRWLVSERRRGAWRAFAGHEPGWGAAFRPLALVLAAGWALAVVASLVRWTSITPGTQGRLLFPAVAPLVLLWVLGIRAWLGRYRDPGSVAVVGALLALSAVVPWAWIAPHYALPVEHQVLPDDAIPIDLVFGDAIRLRGVGYGQEAVHPGETLEVRMYWEIARPISPDEEFMVALHLSDAKGTFAGVENAFPGAGRSPASLWPTERVIEGRQYVRVADDLPVPMVVRVRVGLYAVGTGASLPCSGGESPIIGRTKVIPSRWPKADPALVVARFDWAGGGAEDERAGVLVMAPTWEDQIGPQDEVTLSLTWEVLSAPDRDYSVFVHLEDQLGNVYGIGDGAPRGGLYPTWAWERGEVIEDAYQVVLKGGTPRGRYRLLVGLYDDGGRVPAYDPTGSRWDADAVQLGTVDVR
ncbi:MAG: glycosyltransferase family 39 protein [Anaerolineae bacterium]|nr:glycosyltransferase family 39 protein [Anaerolineae bacterium]